MADDYRFGIIPDERVLPPGLRRDSELVKALTRLLNQFQGTQPGQSGPRGVPVTPKPGRGIVADLADLPPPGAPGALPGGRFGGGGAQTAPGGEFGSDLDRLRNMGAPPSLSQPTPGLGLGDYAAAGANAAIPGLGGLAGAAGAAGSALASGFNYSPSTAGGVAPTGPQPVPGQAGSPPGAPGGDFTSDLDMLRRQGQQSAAAPGGAISGAGGGPPSLAGPASLTGPSPLGGGGAAGGAGADPFAGLFGSGRQNEAVNAAMLEDPTAAVRTAFQQLGIDPFKNRYAQMTINRYGPALDALATVYSWVTTGSPDAADPQAIMPEFLKHFMSGGDVRDIMRKAFDMAASNPVMGEYMDQLGAEQLAQMGAAVTGGGQLQQRARARVLEERLQRRAMQDLGNPNAADDTAYLEDIRRTYGL